MKIALLSANGLGDGLLMMILSHHLQIASHQISFFHPLFKELTPLFPHTSAQPYPPLKDFEKIYSSFDLVILENDHSAKSWELFHLRDSGKLPRLIILFIKPCSKMMRSCDIIFNPKISLVENLQYLCQNFFQLPKATMENAIYLKDKTKKHLYPNKVAIHPTSNDPKRNWKKKQFIKLAHLLKKEGYTPIFCVSEKEKPEWEDLSNYGLSLYVAQDLVDLSQWLYESGYFIGNDSGIGHLASNVGLPTLTISGNPKRITIWRPGWSVNKITTLPFQLPNFKGLVFPYFDGRLRDNYWQYFISAGKVLKRFKELTNHKRDFSI